MNALGAARSDTRTARAATLSVGAEGSDPITKSGMLLAIASPPASAAGHASRRPQSCSHPPADSVSVEPMRRPKLPETLSTVPAVTIPASYRRASGSSA